MNNSPHSPENKLPSLYDMESKEEQRLLQQTKLGGEAGRLAVMRLMTLSLPVLKEGTEQYEENFGPQRYGELIATQLSNLPGLVNRFDPEFDGRFGTYVSRYAQLTAKQLHDHPDSQIQSFKEAVDLAHLRKETATNQPIDILNKLDERDQETVKLLLLPNSESAEALGLSIDGVNVRIGKIMRKAKAKTQTELARILYEAGMKLDLRTPHTPLISLFTQKQLSIARLLDKPNELIAQELDMRADQLPSAITHMKRKSGARSRNELHLMMLAAEKENPEIYRLTPRLHEFIVNIGLKPTDAKVLSELLDNSGLTEKQISCIKSYFFAETEVTWMEVGGNKIAGAAAKQSALEGISKLKERIADKLDRENNPRYISKRELEFCERLGIDPIPLDELYRYLGYAKTDRQEECIEAYFLSREEPTWKEVSTKLGIHEEGASVNANRGIKAIKREIQKYRARIENLSKLSDTSSQND